MGGDDDREKLLRLFPEEIWKLILKNVEDPKSLENLSNSSSFFRQRLLSKRTTFLFPALFGCLMKKYYQYYQLFNKKITNPYEERNEDRALRFPWGLRLVSSDWNKSIEAYFENLDVNPLEIHTRHIYLPRSNFDADPDDTYMLQKFGRLLTKVQLHLHLEETENLAEYYLLLIKYLLFVPNVEELTMKCNTRPNENVLDDVLTLNIELNPFPKLDQLEYLCVFECLPVQILREIVRQNYEFQKLNLSVRNIQSLGFDFSTYLPNLACLDVNIQVYEDLQPLKQFGKYWKLYKFSGQFSYFTDKQIWIEIFEMVENNWGDTLEELSIQFPKDSEPRPVASICELVLNVTIDERLNGMNKLESVKIYSDCAVGLDLLLNCRETLEDITVIQYGIHNLRNADNKYYYPALRRQIVEFLGKENQIRDSNIWDLFPKLKRYHSYGLRIKRPT